MQRDGAREKERDMQNEIYMYLSEWRGREGVTGESEILWCEWSRRHKNSNRSIYYYIHFRCENFQGRNDCTIIIVEGGYEN